MKKVVQTMVVAAGILACCLLMADPGLPGETQIAENLTISGQPSEEQLKALSEKGYTTIINLRPEGEFDGFDESAAVASLGMNYVSIPVQKTQSITAEDAQALHAALEGASGPVLLHCASGGRATGLFAIEQYLMAGASREQAVEIATQANRAPMGARIDAWIEAHPQD